MSKLIFEIYYCLTFWCASVICKVKTGRNVLIRFPFHTLNGNNIKIGNNCFIGKNSRICCYSFSNKGSGIINIGDDFCAQSNLFISSLENGKVEIGNHVLLGSDVMINDNNHVILPKNAECPFEFGEIVIGDHVWIGEKSCILRNVHIGNYVVVGAGSIVTKDVEDYTMVVGNPARPIKKWNIEKQRWEKIVH